MDFDLKRKKLLNGQIFPRFIINLVLQIRKEVLYTWPTMANTKPLTKDDLKAVLKELDVATKADLEQFATKTDLERFATKEDLKALASKEDLARLEQSTKSDIARLEQSTKEGFTKQENTTQEQLLKLERRLKLRMGKHRNEIFTMVGNLATSTPSRREFESLKSQSRFIAHS